MPANPADIALLRQITQSMGRSAKTLERFSKVYRVISMNVEKKVNAAGLMEDIIEKRFENEAESATGAGPWRARQVEPKDGHPILYDTGAMMLSAIRAVRGSFKLDKSQIRFRMVGMPVYAEVHQKIGVGKDKIKRKFFNPPTAAELKAAWAYANKVFKAEVARWLGIRGRR